MSPPLQPLRILYLEDNPLIVFHLEAMVEDLGHIFTGSVASFAELKAQVDLSEVDGALVDIDLADGRTGPRAANWLHERGIPSIFVTGQSRVAAEHQEVVIGTIEKPVSVEDLSHALDLLSENTRPHRLR